MQIRRATPADVATIVELVQRAYGHYVARIGVRPRPMDADYAELVAAHRVWVAVDATIIVGTIVLIAEQDHLEVGNVAVDPQYQGNGVGRALLAFAEDEARRGGAHEVRLFTHAAMTENRAYYPRLGYVQTDRRMDDGLDRVFFAKRVE